MKRLSVVVVMGSLALTLGTQVASAQCHSKGYGGGGYSGGYGYSRQTTVYHPRVYYVQPSYGYSRFPQYQGNFGGGFAQQPPLSPPGGFGQQPPFNPPGDFNQPPPIPPGPSNGPSGGFNAPLPPVPGNPGAFNGAPPIPRPPDPQGPLVGSTGSLGGAVAPVSPNTTPPPKFDGGQGSSNSSSLPVIR